MLDEHKKFRHGRGGVKNWKKSAGVFYGWSLISNLGHSPQEQIFKCKKAICRKGTLESYLRDVPLRFLNSETKLIL